VFVALFIYLLDHIFIYIYNVISQEAKYVERWPNTTSAWAGWSRFYIPVDRYGGVHSQLICTSIALGAGGRLPATRLVSREILIEQNIKKRTGPALWLLCGYIGRYILCFSLSKVLSVIIHSYTAHASSVHMPGHGRWEMQS
jgi:hypothetical protein